MSLLYDIINQITYYPLRRRNLRGLSGDIVGAAANTLLLGTAQHAICVRRNKLNQQSSAETNVLLLEDVNAAIGVPFEERVVAEDAMRWPRLLPRNCENLLVAKFLRPTVPNALAVVSTTRDFCPSIMLTMTEPNIDKNYMATDKVQLSHYIAGRNAIISQNGYNFCASTATWANIASAVSVLIN